MTFIELLEVHNSIHNLNDTVDLPDVLLENYIFVSCNNPSDTRNGEVDLFYKNDLPIKIRDDLSFDELIVVVIVIVRKIILYNYL